MLTRLTHRLTQGSTSWTGCACIAQPGGAAYPPDVHTEELLVLFGQRRRAAEIVNPKAKLCNTAGSLYLTLHRTQELPVNTDHNRCSRSNC